MKRTVGSIFVLLAVLLLGATVPSTASASETYTYTNCQDLDPETFYEDLVCETTVSTILSKSLVQLNYTPVMEQEHIISVAKGMSESLTKSKEVSRTTKVSATVSAKAPLFDAINASLTASYSGTVKETYSTTQVFNGPPESSIYNSRNYYSGTVYDLYNISVSQYTYVDRTYTIYSYLFEPEYVYEYPREELGTTSYNDEKVQVPHFVTYSVDTLY